jgi:valyl-tRNA synthetase
MQMRPQAHDIIRTWAFYTIVKSHYHFGTIPWETLMISGHGLDPAGRSIHKSLGNSPVAPSALIARYGADAVRYWACGGSVGTDQPINEDAMKQGTRLITKLWNAARFIELQIAERRLQLSETDLQSTTHNLQLADRALLSWLQRLIARATASFQAYDYAVARDATERFFWGMLCDNYLEWVKGRLYDGADEQRRAAQYTLHHALRAILKLFAPIMPHVTEEIYQHLYGGSATSARDSIHLSAWPLVDEALIDAEAERAGEALLALTASVRRWKSARKIGLGAELARLTIATADDGLRAALEGAVADLRSVTRAREIVFAADGDGFEEAAPGLRAQVEA